MRVSPPENGGSEGATRSCAFARAKMEEPQVRVRPAENGGFLNCAFARPKMKDPQVRVHPPENRGSAGARSPARK